MAVCSDETPIAGDRLRTTLRRRVGRAVEAVLDHDVFNRAYTALSRSCGAVILMYHSVARESEARWIDPRNHVPPDQFARQMDFLARERRVISMDELLESLRGARTPSRGSVVITFDDGYRDNLTVAAPILDSLGLEATLYLPTGYIDGARTQWVDRAYCAFRYRTRGVSGPLPERSPGDGRACALDYASECAALLEASQRTRTERLSALETQLRPSESPRRLTMNWDDVRELVTKHRCFDIGAHTVDHLDATQLSLAAARSELASSRQRIEDETGATPAHFSFPYGRASDPLREVARRAGFESAVGANAPPLVRAGTSAWALPRVVAPRGMRRFSFLTSSANGPIVHRLVR